jgi:hypothetical protein
MQFHKPPDKHGFAVVCFADKQQIRHTVRSGMPEQMLKLLEDGLSSAVPNPRRSSQARDALFNRPVKFCCCGWE